MVRFQGSRSAQRRVRSTSATSVGEPPMRRAACSVMASTGQSYQRASNNRAIFSSEKRERMYRAGLPATRQ